MYRIVDAFSEENKGTMFYLYNDKHECVAIAYSQQHAEIMLQAFNYYLAKKEF